MVVSSLPERPSNVACGHRCLFLPVNRESRVLPLAPDSLRTGVSGPARAGDRCSRTFSAGWVSYPRWEQSFITSLVAGSPEDHQPATASPQGVTRARQPTTCVTEYDIQRHFAWYICLGADDRQLILTAMQPQAFPHHPPRYSNIIQVEVARGGLAPCPKKLLTPGVVK